MVDDVDGETSSEPGGLHEFDSLRQFGDGGLQQTLAGWGLQLFGCVTGHEKPAIRMCQWIHKGLLDIAWCYSIFYIYIYNMIMSKTIVDSYSGTLQKRCVFFGWVALASDSSKVDIPFLYIPISRLSSSCWVLYVPETWWHPFQTSDFHRIRASNPQNSWATGCCCRACWWSWMLALCTSKKMMVTPPWSFVSWTREGTCGSWPKSSKIYTVHICIHNIHMTYFLERPECFVWFSHVQH